MIIQATLTSFQRSLDHLTQELHKPYSILRDAKFAFLRGKINKYWEKEKSKAAEAIEISDIGSMWASGGLGSLLLTLYMGLHGRDTLQTNIRIFCYPNNSR